MTEKQPLTENATGQESKTKRIVSNSLLLFLRVFFITVINLFSVRYVLKGLGESDYGVYTAVATVVLTCACLLPVLSIAIQRFFSYEMGKGHKNALTSIFTASVNIIVVIIVLAIIFFEIVGPWYIRTQMTIPIERVEAAVSVMHFVLISFAFTLLQLPFLAALFSFENMAVYAFISSVECVLKLGVAIGICHCSGEALVYYAIGLSLVSAFVFSAYSLYVLTHYGEFRYRIRSCSRDTYFSLLSFSGWTMVSAFAGMGLIQGTALLLNLFFTHLTNAAFGVAIYLYNAFTSLTNCIVLAFRPTMVKSYAEGNMAYLKQLFDFSNKLTLYLLLAVSLPIIEEMPEIMQVWLNVRNEETILFARLIIVYSMMLAMHQPITTIIQSTGKIKKYILSVDSFTLLNIPLVWLTFHFGAPSYCALLTMIGVSLVAHVVRLFCLKKAFCVFSFRGYCFGLVIPALFSVLVSCALIVLLRHYIESTWGKFFAVVILIPLQVFLQAFALGVSADERVFVVRYIRKILKRVHLCS